MSQVTLNTLEEKQEQLRVAQAHIEGLQRDLALAQRAKVAALTLAASPRKEQPMTVSMVDSCAFSDRLLDLINQSRKTASRRLLATRAF
eukprot:SAG31_NODE_30541_length_379_cov_1.278571_2_plen_88_part_01